MSDPILDNDDTDKTEPDPIEKLFNLLHIDFYSFTDEESMAILDAVVEAADFLLTEPTEGSCDVCDECLEKIEKSSNN